MNQFQTNLETLDELLRSLEELELNTAELIGINEVRWVKATVQRITSFGKWNTKTMLVSAVYKDKNNIPTEVHLTAAVLATCRKYVFRERVSSSNELLLDVYTEKQRTLSEQNSTARAFHFGHLLKSAQSMQRQQRTLGTVLTLDGSLENVAAIIKSLGDERSSVNIVVIEQNPLIALCHRLMLHNCQDGVESHHRVKAVYGKIEHYISHLSDKERDTIAGVYFDYCGGPPHSGTPSKSRKQMAHLFSLLPQADVFAVTVGKRQHTDVQSDFKCYVPTPYGFKPARVFEHPRVICTMYKRNPNVPRSVYVPGSWWNNCPPDEKRVFYTGRVLTCDENNMHEVYFPFDKCTYQMNAKAIQFYSRATTTQGTESKKRMHSSSKSEVQHRRKTLRT